MSLPSVLRKHPLLTIWMVLMVVTITVALRTGGSIGILPYLVGGATVLLILALSQAWVADELKLRRERVTKKEPRATES